MRSRISITMGMATAMTLACGSAPDHLADGAFDPSAKGGSTMPGGAAGDLGAGSGASSGGPTGAGPGAGAPADAGADGAPPTTGGVIDGKKPGPTNTGVAPGTALTVRNGDLTLTTDGTVIEGLDIQGWVTIDASNVTLRNSIVRGRAGASSNGAGINVRGGDNVLLENVKVDLAFPSRYIDGVWLGYDGAAKVTARGIDVAHGVDGMKISSNSTVEWSWVHDNAWFADDPNVGGPTHNDSLQVLSGSNITVKNNHLQATDDDNAAIQITQDFGAVTNLVVENNWLDGGGCTLNIAHKVKSSLGATSVIANGNRFGRGSLFNCPILLSTQSFPTLSGNVWDDTGATVPIQRHD